MKLRLVARWCSFIGLIAASCSPTESSPAIRTEAGPDGAISALGDLDATVSIGIDAGADSSTESSTDVNPSPPKDGAPAPACDTGPGVVALVDSGLYVYAMALSDSTIYLGTPNGVWSVPRTGGTPSHVSGNDEVDSLAVDSMRVFWAGFCPQSPNKGAAPDPTCSTSTALFAAPLSGGNYSVLAAGAWATTGMLVDSSGIYGSDLSTMWVASPNGGSPRTLTDPTVSPTAFAIQGDTVYVASFGNPGSVVGIPKAGGANVTLVDNQAHPGSIAADASGVYWSDWGTAGSWGALMRANLDGSAVTVLLAGEPSNAISISSLAIDQHDVFWTEQGAGRVMKISKSGGAPQVIAEGLSGPNRIATYGGNIYWLEQPFVDASISVSDSGSAGADAGAYMATTVMTACK